MPDRNLEIALRIRADLDQAVRNLDRLEKELGGVGGAAARGSPAPAGIDPEAGRLPPRDDSGDQVADEDEHADPGDRRVDDQAGRLHEFLQEAHAGTIA